MAEADVIEGCDVKNQIVLYLDVFDVKSVGALNDLL